MKLVKHEKAQLGRYVSNVKTSIELIKKHLSEAEHLLISSKDAYLSFERIQNGEVFFVNSTYDARILGNLAQSLESSITAYNAYLLALKQNQTKRKD